MGERKGQNLYYPPDYDPRVGGLNKFKGTHALRERARKLHMGILIIRFEMPYNIWCDGCNNHIGMGVRYNAEKKKVGMYYTTPVYQFRMKCHLCDNHFEIKTDPGNLDYVIISGARRQEGRWDPTQNEQVVPETKETQKRLFDDPMFKLEHLSGDVQTAKDAKPRLGKLVTRNEDVWKDNYEANCLLRKNFRNKTKELQILKQNDQALLQKSSLDIKLLPETEDDKHLAALLTLKPAFSVDEKQVNTRSNIINSNILPSSSGLITSFGGLKREKLLSQKQLTRNSLGISIKSTGNKAISETSVGECTKIDAKKPNKEDSFFDTSICETNSKDKEIVEINNDEKKKNEVNNSIISRDENRLSEEKSDHKEQSERNLITGVKRKRDEDDTEKPKLTVSLCDYDLSSSGDSDS